MPKLLQINVTANWGSTGKIAEQIGLLAIRQGWESYIAYGRMMNTSKSQLIKIGSQWNVYLHYAFSRFGDLEGLLSKNATRKLLKEIERINPDVIHLHNIHDHYLNYPILFTYLSKRKIPVVWTQHDQWAVTGHCCYIPDSCEKWKTSCHNCPQIEGLNLDRSIKNFKLKKKFFTSLKSLTLVPVSEWLGGIMNDSYLKTCDIKVIHNGIDTNVFCPQDYNVRANYDIGSRKIILGVASDWSERKGLQDLLNMAALLPSDEYVIVVVGKVLQKVELTIKNKCEVIFINRTQNVHELAGLYSSASVFVNPTYQDNYPTTNLEAMACGTPVITYDTGGSPEAISTGTGIVVEQGNVSSLAESVISICERDRKSYTIACRKRAEEYFDKDKCFEKYMELYRVLISNV